MVSMEDYEKYPPNLFIQVQFRNKPKYNPPKSIEGTHRLKRHSPGAQSAARSAFFALAEGNAGMKRIKAVLEYDGSNYHGFQKQINAHTIQAELENCIYKLSGEKVSICGAGRTDAGVHALGQVVAFNTSSSIPAPKWTLALNSFLPEDIRILDSQEAASDFHPQFDALMKSYTYLIYRQKQGASFYRRFALLNSENLNLGEMQRACRIIEGKHNFQAFCASGSSVKSWERTVSICKLESQHACLRLDIQADGFLYNMVRIIMGTLLEVGRQRIKAESLIDILASQDRSQAGPTAAPQGLYLRSVEYPSVKTDHYQIEDSCF